MRNTAPDKNPYNNFKDDYERRIALLARDVRLVTIAFCRGQEASICPSYRF